MRRRLWGRGAGACAALVCVTLAGCGGAAEAGHGANAADTQTATAHGELAARSSRPGNESGSSGSSGSSDSSDSGGGSDSSDSGGGTVIPAVIDHDGNDLAVYARVTIHGHPYLFRVDTGASRTVIYANVAQARGLVDAGATQQVQTVGCAVTDQPVALRDWRLGSVRLPATTAIAQPESSGLAHEWLDGVHVGGLLGNDVLSRLHRLTIDYAGRRLIVGVKHLRGGHRIKLSVHRSAADGIDLTVAATVHGRPADLMVDTGSSTPLLDPGVAGRLALHSTGAERNLSGGAGCADDVTPIRVSGWRLGRLALPAIDGDSSATTFTVPLEGSGVVGLFGSDTLAAFGQATIEYGRQVGDRVVAQRDTTIIGRLVLGGTLG